MALCLTALGIGEALALAFRETAPRDAALPVDAVQWMRSGDPFIAMEPHRAPSDGDPALRLREIGSTRLVRRSRIDAEKGRRL
jgi:hypothetical protein